MLTSSRGGGGGGGRSMLTGGEGGKICQNLADVICERSHTAGANVKFQFFHKNCTTPIFRVSGH